MAEICNKLKILVCFFVLMVGWSSSSSAKDYCFTKSETIIKNGVQVSSKETKICEETELLNYGFFDFITDDENEELVVLTAIWILTHL